MALLPGTCTHTHENSLVQVRVGDRTHTPMKVAHTQACTCTGPSSGAGLACRR